MEVQIDPSRALRARSVAYRARSVCFLVFVAVLLAAPAQAQWPVTWPEDDTCRKTYSVSREGYPKYIECLVSNMPALDPKNRHSFSERYDPRKYGECRLATDPRDTSCEPYRLRRRPHPEYWPNAGKVPPVKWPDAPAQSVHRKGMKPKEYFDALCKAEAGEFIYRTVEGVEGIYQIRPRLRANDYELRDRYVLEDPYGYTDLEASDPELVFVSTRLYRFLETPRLKHSRFGPTSPDRQKRLRHESYFLPAPPDAVVARYSGFDRDDFRTMIQHFDSKAKSRFGYTWRGIRRVNDRELGIAGGEVIVVDLETNEVMALWRGFAQNRAMKSPGQGISWESAAACPLLPDGKYPKDFIKNFVIHTLRPKSD